MTRSASFTVFGLTIAIPICLWVPTDARAFYGQGPLWTSTAPAAQPVAPTQEPPQPAPAPVPHEPVPEPVTAVAAEAARTCSCGEELRSGDRFCCACGAAAPA